MKFAAHGITISPERWIDIQDLVTFKWDGNKTGMSQLAGNIINEAYHKMKSNANSEFHERWESYPLPLENLRYAAIHGFICYELYKHIKELIDEGVIQSIS
jgi:hypothetical protein